MRIAPQGFKFIAACFAAGSILAVYAPTWTLSVPFFLLGVLVSLFFRDPERTPPPGPHLLVCPADGKVVYTGRDASGQSERIQVSIFLSIFNVHINRSPLAGEITRVKYTPGRFVPAYKPEASLRNEQNEIELTDGKWRVTVRQIAGVVARRIVFYRKKNDCVEKGERIGLIQFGSRVEVLLPHEAKLQVTMGEKVKGGETILAERP
ncbi:MAG: phosphatidylserine decarboxylase family protein [Acidobacteriota bacterium]